MNVTAYDERRPAPDLRAEVACTWVGRIGDDGVPYTDQVLPDGCVDIVWDGSRLFVAGPDTGPVPLVSRPGATFVGIRFRTGRAALALGCPASTLRDQRADLADLWGAGPTRALADRLAETPGTPASVRLLESAIRGRMINAAPPDRVVQGLVAALSAGPTPGPGLVSTLAGRLGVTERSLHRRCSSAVGYGPKTLDRVLRFRRALEVGTTAPATNLGALAVSAGYADQAHFTREFRRLASRTPSELFKTAR